MYGRCRSYHKIYHLYHMLHWQMVFFCNKTNFFQRFVDLCKSLDVIIIIFSYHISIPVMYLYLHGTNKYIPMIFRIWTLIMSFLKEWILIYRLFKRNVSADTFLLKFILQLLRLWWQLGANKWTQMNSPNIWINWRDGLDLLSDCHCFEDGP